MAVSVNPRIFYRAPSNPGNFALLQPRLLFVAEFVSLGKWVIPTQHQDFYTVSFVQDGDAQVTVGKVNYSAAPGEVLIYSPRQAYRARALAPFADYRTIIFRFTTGDRTVLPVRFQGAAQGPVRRVLSLLLDTAKAAPGDERALKGLILDLLALAHESWTPAESRDALRCREAAAQMKSNLAAPFALAVFARRAELSPSRFAHVFRAQMGESPRGHFMRLKLAEAKRLLIQSEGGVTSVSDALGFSSIHHFSRWFSLAEGRNPTAFLRKLRADVSHGERVVQIDGPSA